MEQATGKKILIIYNSRNTGRQTVTGPVTKQSYGYRKDGDKFEVYEADMRVRPDLFRPVKPLPQAAPVVGVRGHGVRRRQVVQETPDGPQLSAPPPPPPPKKIVPMERGEEIVHVLTTLPDSKLEWPIEELDWSDTKVNAGHLKLLGDHGILTLADLDKTSEAELLKIKGIGEATVRSVYAMKDRYEL